MKSPHYLRFVSALALATLPGCAGSPPEESQTDAQVTQSSPDANTAVTDAATTTPTTDSGVEADAITVADTGSEDAGNVTDDAEASVPFSSGPIVPPEMPRGFA